MNKHLGIKLITAVIAITAVVFLWSLNSHRLSEQKSDTWVDERGHLHVLNLVLGKTTLREAEIALKSRSDTAIYIYPENHPQAGITLESYFPSIADHSKVILQLETSPQLLKQVQERSTLPHLYPNKVARMNLHPEDLEIVQQLKVVKATLIPSIRISYEMLSKRFGEALKHSISDDGTSHYDYPALGLHATLPKDDPARLQFTNPSLNR